MKTAKFLVIVFFLFLQFFYVSGQNPNNRRERIKIQKIAFITSKLQLTPEEAQQFWPVYNEFDNKIENLNKEKNKELRNYVLNKDNISDSESVKVADDFIQYGIKLANLKQEYHLQFKKILTAKKVVSLYMAEGQFKQYLIKQIRNKNAPKRRDNFR
ncbi:MAG: hypothetical protein KAG95_01310 [Bacteroidales bacterium]|nr:hypothetical protein [Bacteroidales bacterium]